MLQHVNVPINCLSIKFYIFPPLPEINPFALLFASLSRPLPPGASKGYPRRLRLQWGEGRLVVRMRRRVHDPLGRDPERLVLRLEVVSAATAAAVGLVAVLQLRPRRGRAAPLHHLTVALLLRRRRRYMIPEIGSAAALRLTFKTRTD